MVDRTTGQAGAKGLALTWLGVITGILSLAGYWLAMANAPQLALHDAEVQAAENAPDV
ncbi:MAG: hypothetical protein IT546_08160 [Caulobacteraceae bacterium]|nr:hypothetical protein [Caulobacteraceae bacterium]